MWRTMVWPGPLVAHGRDAEPDKTLVDAKEG
jgi:hypothetical protein